MIYFDERIKSKISKGKRLIGKSRKTSCKLQGSRRTCLIPSKMSVTAHVKCHQPGKFITDSVPRVLLGDDLVGPSAWNIIKFQISRRKAGIAELCRNALLS